MLLLTATGLLSLGYALSARFASSTMKVKPVNNKISLLCYLFSTIIIISILVLRFVKSGI
jgi:hypothetical protein